MLREPRLVIRQVIVTKLNVINGSFPPNSLLQSASGRVPQPDSRIAGSRCQPIKINCYACCRVSTRAQQSIARDLVHPSFPQSSHDPKRATKFSLPRCAVTTGSLSLQIWSADQLSTHNRTCMPQSPQHILRDTCLLWRRISVCAVYLAHS